ncbi:MAG TPA: PAS domain S-box protein [Bacteroidia bacterium]|nr:PAS domain S-box protein [Bacteroidia bacterium]
MKKTDKSVVLLVDDKAANLFSLENLLVAADRTFLTAANGKDALKLALNKEIDLIILDVQMPDMDGFEVAQILKSNKKTRDIPIIFASAERKEHRFMLKGYEEGAIDYLFKPLDPGIAKAKVAVQLKIRSQKKELLEKNRSLMQSELLIENSADIIGIIDATTLKIEEVNHAFQFILGYTPKEAKESPLFFFLANEERAMIQELSRQDKERLSFETRIYCKDRTKKWLQWNVVVKNGKWFFNARDITEIMKIDRIRNYLATVVKQSSDAIYIHDHEGRIISWNEGAEKIYGYSENEALQMKIWNIIPAQMHHEIEETVGRILAGEKIESHEAKRITRNGKLVDVLFSASVITDGNSELRSIAITERDITQQKIDAEQISKLNKELEEKVLQLVATNNELESFSYSVSHDLRAPLRALSGYSQMIEEDYGSVLDEEGMRLLGNIQSNARRMGILTDELLAFSRLGRKEIQKTQLDMEKIVRNVVLDAERTSPHRAVISAGEIFPATGDHTLIQQVWVNLISNAIKYSAKKENPRVEIGATRSDGFVTYFVKDNGAGFNMDYADKLFGVFQRLHNPNEFEGTGIGLAIVHRVITKHGGRVWAEAKKDEGATFYFTLPEE